MRPKRRRLERVVNEVLNDVEPGVMIRFNEMDFTEVRSDADFFERMLRSKVVGFSRPLPYTTFFCLEQE